MINKTMKKPAAFLLAASMLTSIFSGNVYAAEVLEDTTEVVAEEAFAETNNETTNESIGELDVANVSNLDGFDNSAMSADRSAYDSNHGYTTTLHSYKVGSKGYEVADMEEIRYLYDKINTYYDGCYHNEFDDYELDIEAYKGFVKSDESVEFTYYKYSPSGNYRTSYNFKINVESGAISNLFYMEESRNAGSYTWFKQAKFEAPLHTQLISDLTNTMRYDKKPKPAKYLKFKKCKDYKNYAKVKPNQISDSAIVALSHFNEGIKCIHMTSLYKNYYFYDSPDWRTTRLLYLEDLTVLIPKSILLYNSMSYPIKLYPFEGYKVSVSSTKPCVKTEITEYSNLLITGISKGSSVVNLSIYNLDFKIKVKVKQMK